MQMKSVAIAPQVLAIGHIGLASHSLVLCRYWHRNKSPDLGGCTVTHSTASEKEEKKKIKRDYYATTDMRSSEEEAETFLRSLILQPLGLNEGSMYAAARRVTRVNIGTNIGTYLLTP